MTAHLQLPPGFRFHPTDDELVMHYLCRKCASQPISSPVIAELDLYKYDPWHLPEMAPYGEKEWYFFSPRDRKYPNGSRPNRTAGTGYWKATGADKPIGRPKPVGIKKALVFYAGKAPRGEKTNWIMHEYRLADVDRSARKNSLRLDDWVLCRIYNKKGTLETSHVVGRNFGDDAVEQASEPLHPAAYFPSDGGADSAFSRPCMAFNEYGFMETSDSMPKLQAESSCSGEAACPAREKEVQRERRWNWEKAALDFTSSMNLDDAVDPVQTVASPMSPLLDMFMYLGKPM